MYRPTVTTVTKALHRMTTTWTLLPIGVTTVLLRRVCYR